MRVKNMQKPLHLSSGKIFRKILKTDFFRVSRGTGPRPVPFQNSSARGRRKHRFLRAAARNRDLRTAARGRAWLGTRPPLGDPVLRWTTLDFWVILVILKNIDTPFFRHEKFLNVPEMVKYLSSCVQVGNSR